MSFRRIVLSIVLSLMASACIGPQVPVVRLDDESAAAAGDGVKVYAARELRSVPHDSLGPITATSCMNKIWDKPASREDAVAQILYQAQLVGADGIDSLLCERPEGTNMAKNCWNSVTCHARAVALLDAPRRAPEPAAGPSTGTGIVVTSAGHVLTAAHVVDGCRSIQAASPLGSSVLRVIKADETNDLAILAAERPMGRPASFRDEPALQVGEDVVVAGYPLAGLLASELNVTTGTLSALAGFRNASHLLQISAPVQQGNSGGPLLDRSGLVIGVVVSKLDALAVASVSGDIPQNINFAVNAKLLDIFLAGTGVTVTKVAADAVRSTAEVARTAAPSVVFLACNI